MGSLAPSITRARVYIVLAAVLWSSGSLFMRILREPLGFSLDQPSLDPLQIAFFRGVFAGLVLMPLVRRREVRLTPTMLGMVICFGLMSGLYLSALGLGQAANAILLQNSAPVWVYLIGVYFLGDTADQRNWRAILVGFSGTIVIVAGNWLGAEESQDGTQQPLVLLMGLGSGLTYAGVVLFLRTLRSESSAWLMVLNLLGGALIIGLYILVRDGWPALKCWLVEPSARQFVFLFVFGAVQMAAPYWLFASGLRTISPQEAGIITLLEPLLNPVWAYLLVPVKETPTVWTVAGGVLLLTALGTRYRPTFRRVQARG